MKKLSQWRTVISVLILATMCLFAFWLAGRMPESLAMHIFDTIAWTFLGMAFVLAGKSGVQYLAGGGGVKGAMSALLTTAKPEDSVASSTSSPCPDQEASPPPGPKTPEA